MMIQSLCGAWQFRQAGATGWLPATVPGCVHTDLMAAGRIPDPFAGQNEKQAQWVAGQDWEYQREFSVEAGLLAEERVELACAGLDTLAELSLNGQPLGKTDNMFYSYRWEVKNLLLPGINILSVIFRSPVAYIQAQQKIRRLPALSNPGAAQLRKIQSHFGWDWGPGLPTAGIWREISLQGFSTARLSEVHLRQQHENGRAAISVSAQCQRWSKAALTLSLALAAPGGGETLAKAVVDGERASLLLPVENPWLWWPNGSGAQPLYQATVTLLSGERPLDQRSYQIGLRTIELRQEPDEWGETFTFMVNGVPIFAKGANWIPADSFITRLADEKLAALLQSAAKANMNMIRAWGGGTYESDRFYDLCDRFGLLVWQDFGFACTPYPLDAPEFLENVHHEVVENIRRLRHHACLAVWCGNNELEALWRMFRAGASLTQACERFFYHELRKWVQAEDPDHAYWPGSPCSGTFMKDTGGDGRGDSHNWKIWHGLAPFRDYRKSLTRFASEFGMQALPSMETIACFAQPEEYDLSSGVMLHHQRSSRGNGKLIYYLAERFRLPRDFADLVTLTQIDQAEAVRTGVEHWRRNRPRCSGALYWQLNDCWPAISWSSLDYYGRWKALHYAARRFFASVALSLEDKGARIGLFVANDLPTAWEGEARWSLETLTGEVLEAGCEPVAAAPLVATCARKFDFAQQLRRHGRKNLVFVAELWQNGDRLALQAATFAPEKCLHLPDAHISTEIKLQEQSLAIRLHARALARFVELSLTGADVIFSDNYFDLPAGRAVEITCGLPVGWTLEQARERLRVRSLADIKPAGWRFFDQLKRWWMLFSPINLITRAIYSVLK